jgi:hypothetical protein
MNDVSPYHIEIFWTLSRFLELRLSNCRHKIFDTVSSLSRDVICGGPITFFDEAKTV